MIDPALQIWGVDVAVYLFLGGLVAGMMVILGYFLFKGRHKELRCSCALLPGLGIILLSAGMFALFLDLEHRWQFWRMYVTFKPASPMSWGSWILLLVYPSLLAALLLRLPEPAKKALPFLRKAAEGALEKPGLVRAIGIANIALGGMLGIYTGILLSTLGARPLWNSPMLGFLFLVSGLSTAAAFVHLIARDPYERQLLARADNGFLGIELFVLVLFVVGLLTSTEVHIQAAHLILSGPYAPAFLVLVVGLGIVIPLLIQSLAVSHRIPHTPATPVMVIAGGFVLRLVIVYAGQASHWAARLSLPK
jgi:formate-dependent nitrite reductase membrane component NrfD